jgi:hypothetical protein
MSQIQSAKSSRIFFGRVSYLCARVAAKSGVRIMCDTAANSRREFTRVSFVASVTSEACYQTFAAVMEIADSHIDALDATQSIPPHRVGPRYRARPQLSGGGNSPFSFEMIDRYAREPCDADDLPEPSSCHQSRRRSKTEGGRCAGGRVAKPFGFALTDPNVRLSRIRLFPKSHPRQTR